jgi:predicted permease
MWTDLRHAVRSLVRARWFTLGAIATFALGIGVNVAVFSAVDRILFRKLPYTASQELVLLRQCDEKGNCAGSFPSQLAFEARTRTTTLGEMAVAGLSSSWRIDPASDVRLTLIEISPNLLRVIGVRPTLGHDVTEDDIGAKRPVAFISHDVWRRQFGSDPAVIGRQLLAGTTASVAIAGVLPEGFVSPGWVSTPDWQGLLVQYSGWSAIAPTGAVNPPIARLKPGATIAQARAEIRALAAALAAAAPPSRTPSTSSVRVDSLEGHLFSRFTDYAWLVVAAAAAVLLMACANLGGLLLARGRSRETIAALRTALGASRARVIGSAVLETLLICVAGALVVLVVLAWSSEAIRAFLPPLFRQYAAGIVDARVLLFAFGIASVCAIAAGAWPGVSATRVDLLAALQRGSGRLRQARLGGGRTLLFVEAALGVLLVVGCVGALRSFNHLVTEDLGFDAERLYRASAGIQRMPPADMLAAYEQKLDALRAVPGVEAVCGSDSVVTDLMTAMSGYRTTDGGKGPRYEVSAGYFRCIGGTLIAGREFNADEVRARAPVALVSATAAAQIFPGRSPAEIVGETLPLSGDAPRVVLGVTKDLREFYGDRLAPSIFVPLGANPSRYAGLLVRLAGDRPADFANLKRAISEVNPSAVSFVPTNAAIGALTTDPRFRAILMSVLAIVAIVLASAGLYALAGFELARRTSELGVRLALGASPARLQRVMVSDMLRPVLLGSAVGVLIAYWAASLVQSLLYNVDARDPATFVVAVLLLLIAAAAAAWIPARRAARTDPATVLRAP